MEQKLDVKIFIPVANEELRQSKSLCVLCTWLNIEFGVISIERSKSLINIVTRSKKLVNTILGDIREQNKQHNWC